jgi:Tfp pilus assembly protein PilO
MEAIKGFRREILGAMILVAFSFFFHRFIYLKGVDTLRNTDTSITSTLKEITRVRAETEAIEGLKKSVAEATDKLLRVEAGLRRLEETLPSEKHVSEILARISGGVAESDIRILSIKPLPAEEREGLTRLPFQINMETHYIPFGEYLVRIENLPRLMIVDNFMIEIGEGKPTRLNARLFLSAYVLGPGS